MYASNSQRSRKKEIKICHRVMITYISGYAQKVRKQTQPVGLQKVVSITKRKRGQVISIQNLTFPFCR